jgi:hypothetical protein
MKICLVILGIFLFSQNNLCAQTNSSNKLYILNAHIGADLAKGFRFGFLVYLQEHISIDASYGRDVFNFLVPTDPNERYSIGINWHKGCESRLIAGISFSHSVFPSRFITKQNFLSANIGSFIINEGGVQFYYKGGFLVRFEKDNAGKHLLLFPNIDIGLSYNIF